MKTINLPDGRTIQLTGEESPEQLGQLKAKLRSKYGDAKKSKGNDAGAGNAFAYGISGGQIPFGNRITSAMAATGAKASDIFRKNDLFEGQSVGDLYEQSLADTKATQEAHPNATLAGNVTGIATTLPMMSSKVLFGDKATKGVRGILNEIPEGIAVTGNFIRGSKTAKDAGILARTGNRLLQGGKSAALAYPVGFLYGAGEADTGEMLEGGRRAGRMASTISFASPVVGGLALDGFNKLNKKSVFPRAEKIRKMASSLYEKADKRGGTLKSEFVDDFLVKAERELLSGDEVIRQMKSNKPLMDAFDDLTLLKNQPMSLQRAQAIDEQLGDMITTAMKEGRQTKTSRALMEVQSTFRDMIEGADEALVDGGKEGFEALKKARKLWSTSRKMDDIERIIQRAQMMQQPANSIKAGFRTLYNNKKRMRGYSKAEREAIKKAAESGVVSDLLSTFGSRLTGIIGLGSGNPMLAGAGYVGSKVSRDAAEAMQMKRANNILETIAEGAGKVKTRKRISPPNIGGILSNSASRQGALIER